MTTDPDELSRQREHLPWDQLISSAELAELLGISKRTVIRLAAKGELPEPLEITSHTIRWRARDVQHYLDGLRPRVLIRQTNNAVGYLKGEALTLSDGQPGNCEVALHDSIL